MGYSRFFGRKPLKLNHLLNGKIDLDRKGTLSERVDFAWTAYTGNNAAQYKTAAFNFLIKAFKIPETTKEEQEQKLHALMALKQKNPDKNFIPSLTDLPKPPPASPRDNRLKLTKLTAIPVPPQPTPPPVSETASLESSKSAKHELAADMDDSNVSERAKSRAEADFNGELPDDPDEDQLTQFATEVSLEIDKLNKLIERYNLTTNETQKAHILFDIFQLQKHINNQYPANKMNASQDYREQFHTTLFKEMQEQFNLLGIHSLNEEFIKKYLTSSTPTPTPEPWSLPEIIANMPPEKADKMLELLSANKKGDLTALQHLFEPSDPGYKNYQLFLKNHHIEFLGGANSRNFKVTSNLNGTILVLKVDNRLDAPKDAEAHLRSSTMSHVLSPVYAERTVTHGSNTRTLLVTEYSTGGNLEEHGNKIGHETERAKHALNIYTQMATILQQTSANGCAFNDMKNTNWLIKANGVLQIADTKSFVFTDTGQVNFQNKTNRWYQSLSTPYMNPREMAELHIKPASADKIHSYMLGKNLYQYLSGCSCKYLDDHKKGLNYDFSNPIFSTPEGKDYKELIIATVKLNPDLRISIDEVRERLTIIGTKIATRELLKELEELKEPTNAEFLHTKNESISTASQEELMSLQETIRSKITETKLQINRQETQAMLQDPHLLDDPTAASFIQKKTSSINTATKEQLLLIKQEITSKITEIKELKAIKTECKELIEQLKTETKDKGKPDKMASIQNLEVRVASESNKTKIHLFKAKIETKLDFERAFNAMRAEAPHLLDQIKEKGFSKKDSAMNKYIKEKTSAMDKVKDKRDIDLLLADLKGTLAKLEEPKQINETRAIMNAVENLRSLGPIYKVKATKKADEIEEALGKVPLSQRGHIQEGKTSASTKVLKALGNDNPWPKSDVASTSKSTRDESKATSPSVAYKSAVKEMKATHRTDQNLETDEKHQPTGMRK